jgi:hypothetical protein
MAAMIPDRTPGAAAPSVMTTRRHERRDLLMAAALAACAWFVYTLGPVEFLSNDTRPALLTAMSLVLEGDFDLDEYRWHIVGQRRDLPYYVLTSAEGGIVSRFGIGAPLAALPVFALILTVTKDLTVPEVFAIGRYTASMYVAFAVALVFLCARRMGYGLRMSIAAAAIYGFGTAAFSVASQALWQHGPAQMFLALALWSLLNEGRGWLVLGGAALGFMAICRPPDSFIVLAIAAAVIISRRRQPLSMAAFTLSAAPFAIAQLLFNTVHFGSPFIFAQTIEVVGQGVPPYQSYWQAPIFTGLVGLLLSPSRGLFVYSPVFLWLFAMPRKAWYRWPVPLRGAVIGSVLMFLMLSRYYGWYGGWCFGYRMLADATPALTLALLPTLQSLNARTLPALVASALLSIIIHSAGAYNYSPGDWDRHPNIDQNLDRLWSLTDSQLVYVLTQPKSHLPPR